MCLGLAHSDLEFESTWECGHNGFSRKGTDWVCWFQASKPRQCNIKKKKKTILEHAMLGHNNSNNYIYNLCEFVCAYTHTHTHTMTILVCVYVCKYIWFCIHSKIFEVSLQSKNLHRFFHCSVRRDSQD